jgi:hypothetical protein
VKMVGPLGLFIFSSYSRDCDVAGLTHGAKITPTATSLAIADLCRKRWLAHWDKATRVATSANFRHVGGQTLALTYFLARDLPATPLSPPLG